MTMFDSSGLAVIWDMDGTLVDTAELHYCAWAALAADIGQPFTRADFTATFGKRNPEIIRELFGTHTSAADIDDLGWRKEEMYRTAARAQGVALLPGARTLLEGLHNARFKQAIGSSAPRGNLDLILQLTGIERFFDAVVSMEDTERGKPDPQVFLIAAGKLNVPPQRCLVFEDAPAGVQAAKAGGMKCIAVRFIGHHPEAVLRAAGADRSVHTLEEISVEVVQQILE